MKNHFLIPYFGNKRQEVKNIYEIIKDHIKDINIICEPFCGTSALSYYISTLHPKKYKYVLNDNNKYLIELYKNANNDISLNNIVDDLKNIYDKIKSKEDYNKLSKNDCFINWLYLNIIFNIRPGLYPTSKLIKKERFDNLLTSPIIKFLRNEDIIILNDDWFNVYNLYKDNKTFIFFDPPYINCNNDYYIDPTLNIYEYFSNNDIKNIDTIICFCLEKNWIIKLLFKNYIVYEYNKTYETTQKKTEHLIIINK